MSKEKVDIAEVLESLGVERISDKGDEVSFSCPQDFHARGDRNPSASINKKTQAYHCFSCGAKGTVFTLVGDVLGVSPAVAIRWVKDKFYLEEEIEQRSVKKVIESMLNPKDDPEQLPKWIDEKILDQYGVDWDKAKEHYDDGTLPSKLRRPFENYGLEPQTLKEYRIGFDQNTDRITVPIRDEKGKLVQIKARATNSKQFPKYLGLGDKEGDSFGWPRLSDKSLVWGLDTATGDAILVEGEFDAISLRQKGFSGSIASGTANVTKEQAKKIVNKFERVTILYDADEGGVEGANKVAETIGTEIPVRIAQLDSSDPAEASKEVIESKIKESQIPIKVKQGE